MTDAAGSASELDAECRVFARYLTGEAPTPYIEEWYRKGHGAWTDVAASATPLDALLLRIARRGPRWTGMADSYARWSRPDGVLRHKLILLLALMEHAPPYHRRLTHPMTGSWGRIGLRLTGLAGRYVLVQLGAVLLVGPRHLVLRLRSDGG